MVIASGFDANRMNRRPKSRFNAITSSQEIQQQDKEVQQEETGVQEEVLMEFINSSESPSQMETRPKSGKAVVKLPSAINLPIS